MLSKNLKSQFSRCNHWSIFTEITCFSSFYVLYKTKLKTINISDQNIYFCIPHWRREAEEVHCAPGCGCVKAGTLLHIQAQIRSPSSIVLLSRHWSSHPAPSGYRPEGQIKGKKCRRDQKRSNSTTREHRKETKKLLTCAGDAFGRLCRWPYKKKRVRTFTFQSNSLNLALCLTCYPALFSGECSLEFSCFFCCLNTN